MSEEITTGVLTCTNGIGTLVQEVDATTNKLMKRLQEIETESARLRRERDAITTALAVAGIRPPAARQSILTYKEIDYRQTQPFTQMTLTDACLKVLCDHSGEWMTKAQVEYLVVRGGYKFVTKDQKNSVGITLRRLVDPEIGVEVQRVRGSQGSTYRYVKPEEGNDDVNSRATK